MRQVVGNGVNYILLFLLCNKNIFSTTSFSEFHPKRKTEMHLTDLRQKVHQRAQLLVYNALDSRFKLYDACVTEYSPSLFTFSEQN